MQLKRVVITGCGAVSPYGRGVDLLMDGLMQGKSAVSEVSDLADIGGLKSRVAALVPGIDPKEIPRKFRRSMSNMSIYATLASYEAMQQAGVDLQAFAPGRIGVSIGSTIGSITVIQSFFKDFFTDYSLERMKSTLFFKMMNHSCASNVAQTLGLTGRLLAPSAACSTGCQAVGYGYEMIALGRQDLMLCGGADEFHPLTSATFDVMNAGSTGFNDCPARTPRPFDRDRDGMVCAEGGGIVVLESLDSARGRGAHILAEVVGFATVSDPSSIANPSAESMEHCMEMALADAGLAASQVDYVNAHATATEQGDIAESEAIFRVFGPDVPVSSLKGHMGHTMAASGALELLATVEMMRSGTLIPTFNLENVDPACEKVRHLQQVETQTINTVVKNNFALGGVNSSIVLRRYAHD